MLLTGDSLFVGDAARPDLATGAAEGAEGLFHSLRRLEALADDVGVYPGHVAGSLCGASLSSDPASTMGFERRFNRALQISAVEDFIADALSKTTPRPPNMDRIVELNRGPFVGAPEPVAHLDGATPNVLDVRDSEDFAAAHLPRAVNVPLSGTSFATKSGFVLPDGPVTIHAASDEQADEAARGLRAVGIFDLAGYVVDPPGMSSHLDPVDLDELEQLMQANEVVVLDVRESDERDEGYIAGSRHMPYRLLAAVSDGLGELPVVTICTTGARAAIAASLLAAHGIEARPVLEGGVEDWEERGGRTIEFRRCGS
jgi:rhodanese-related sulfurtransferase